ncbi:MAG TPA: hypothetical protein VHP34_02965 [Alphaproteobacteria bacterium]|nr:hypothetical protein [Alphaproteobacteria bacterium]
MTKKKTNNTEALLKKKIKDLTAADFSQLEKPLGTSSRPFPMWGPQRVEHNGRSDIETVLSFIASDAAPLMVFSERPYEEVVALAYCDMPVPSMLPIFKDGLERRADPLVRQKDIVEGRQPQNENFNRTQMMIGDPGHGKSFLGALQGRLRTKGSVEIFDCGGKNMNDLLFEMVLDFGAGDALPKAIDKRLKAGALEDLSVGLLKSLPSKAVSTDKEGNIESIDWAYLKTAGAEEVQSAFKTLTEVSKVEGLDNAGGNALGMNSQFGPLIRAFQENREIVLDEYNKSREGSDNALQTVIQFMIGELRECTVDNPLKNKDNTSGPSSFTFKRDDMGAGFFVTFTGNKTEDGTTTRSLNKSVYDRLKPDTLPDPDVIDWQHRICQMMVGLPVSTLYTTFQEEADKDPEAFGEWLMWLRKTKAQVEGTPVPELQETLLTNWQNVVQSSEKLALFYDRWSGMTDAEKIITNNNADLIEEVDEEYTKKEGMSFRRIKQHLEEAIPIRSRMEPVDSPVKLDMKSWNKPPQLAERVEENPSLHFGSRLVEFIERMAYEKSGAVGKNRLYTKLLKAMEEYGLRDISLQEGARSQQKSVEEALNISAFSDKDINKQAAMARKIFCDFVRQMDPEIKAEDDQIVTPKKFVDALKYVQEKETAPTNELFVANRDPESLYAGRPLAEAIIKDAAVYALENKDIDFSIDALVHHDDLIASFALPTVGAKNLSAIWDQNIRPLTGRNPNKSAEQDAEQGTPANDDAARGSTPAAEVPDADEPLRIAENRSKHGIATTSLQVRYEDAEGERPVAIHIVRNEQRNKTLIVSEKVPSKLLAAFREAGVIHVDRNDPLAKTKVDAALTEMTRGMQAGIKDILSEAFMYRSAEDEDAPKTGAVSLVDRMLDKDLEPLFPKFVVKNDKRANGPQ